MKKKEKQGINIELGMNNDQNGDFFIPSHENIPSSNSSEFSKKNWKCILGILLGIIIALGGAAVLVYFFVIRNNDNTDLPSTSSPSPEIPISPQWTEDLDVEKITDVFSSSFKISSKEKTLNQLSQKSFHKYETKENGQKTSYFTFNKAIYDIYTINSTSAPENMKIIYNTKYTTVITVKSLCSKISLDPENDDCELETKLDLNKKGENNLRRNEENPEDLIRKALLPICIVEHTDTNLLLSISCPDTLSKSFKEDILKAFGNIKPGSIKGFEFDKDYVDSKKEEKDDKIYINSFDNVCQDLIIDQNKITICNQTTNIITDKEGNLISTQI